MIIFDVLDNHNSSSATALENEINVMGSRPCISRRMVEWTSRVYRENLASTRWSKAIRRRRSVEQRVEGTDPRLSDRGLKRTANPSQYRGNSK